MVRVIPGASLAAVSPVTDEGVRVGQQRMGHLGVVLQQQRPLRTERHLQDVDPAGVVRLVRSRAHVAEDLVAARVAHGIDFGEIVAVFTFPDG